MTLQLCYCGWEHKQAIFNNILNAKHNFAFKTTYLTENMYVPRHNVYTELKIYELLQKNLSVQKGFPLYPKIYFL